jgi:uroporphyrinogen decarboxylase
VDPAVLLGPTGKIREATQRALSQLNGIGHILNLGHGISKQTPVENARLFIETGQQTLIGSAGKMNQPTSAAYSR